MTDTLWIGSKIFEMKSTLDLTNVPEINRHCHKRMYLDTGKVLYKGLLILI